MKRAHFLTCLLLALVLWGQADARTRHTKRLFVLLGQSNMAGRAPLTEDDMAPLPMVKLLNDKGVFETASNPLNKYSCIRKSLAMQKLGPGYSFAKELSESFYNDTIYLIVNARGGMAVEEFMKGHANQYYENTVKRIKQAMDADPALELTAIIWHQGESNAKNWQEYPALLKELVTSLRNDLHARKALFVAGEIGEWVSDGKDIGRTLLQVPEYIPYAAVVSSQGLGHIGDKLHFDNQAQRQLGKRYAEAVMKYTKAGKRHNKREKRNKRQ